MPLHLFLWPQVFLGLWEGKKKRTRRDPRIQEKHLVGPTQSWLIAEVSLKVETETIGKEGSIRGCWSTQQRCPGISIGKDESLMSGFIKGSLGDLLIPESSRGWAWKLTF